MFIYEAKNILVDGTPCNGLIFKSTVGTSELIPAKDGESCSVIYVYSQDEKPMIDYLGDYEFKKNDTEELPDDVKILAYQGKVDEFEGLIFKPILSTNEPASLQEGETAVMIIEKESGEYLDAPSITVVTAGSQESGGSGRPGETIEPIDPNLP
jgi:hypothetical protein